MGAVLLATLEQVSTSLGKLSFILATVVLLGGFVVDLEKNDFYFITVLLVGYGIRTFRRHNLSRRIKKPKVFSRIQALMIALSVVSTIVIVFVLGIGLTIFVLLLIVFSLVGGWFSAGSELSFVIIYNAALYNVEICLTLLNLGASIHWLQPPHYKYPRSNEFVAMICFFSVVIAESSLFLIHRGCWQVISLRYVLDRKRSDRPRFLLETKSKFFAAVYQTTLRDGAIKGLEMGLVDYVAQKFVDARSNRQLRRGILMLDAVCGIDEGRRPSGKYLLASNRGVVDRLFQCMSKSYFLAYRRAAISLVARICEDGDAFFAVAQMIRGNPRFVSLLVEAFDPDVNKTVLELLRRMAAFGGVADAEPGVMEEFDFGDGSTHKRWTASLDGDCVLREGGPDDGGRDEVDEELGIENCRRKTARGLRRMILMNTGCMRYVADAASCSRWEIREVAAEIMVILGMGNAGNSIVNIVTENGN